MVRILLADDLIYLNDYAKEHNFSWHTMRKWLDNGLRHLDEKPYKTTLNWINEYIETHSVQKENSTIMVLSKQKYKIPKKQGTSCTKKINIEDFL